MTNHKCPVCRGTEFQAWGKDKYRSYWLCQICDLVSIPREQILNPQLEKARYEVHENSENDEQYQTYLGTIANSISSLLPKNLNGLDFGCGKTTLLAQLLTRKSFSMNSYDIFFHPDKEVLQKKYDFIVMSEVIEHLSEPLETMRQLNELLNPGGFFFIKTKFYPAEKGQFAEWFYKRDQTHVQFFNETCMRYLGKLLHKSFVQTSLKDLYLLR